MNKKWMIMSLVVVLSLGLLVGCSGDTEGELTTFAATAVATQSAIETANDPGIEKVDDFVDSTIDGQVLISYGATAFRKEDDDFREAFNAELRKLQDSGELLKIIEPFGFTESELPGDMTVEEIVQ